MSKLRKMGDANSGVAAVVYSYAYCNPCRWTGPSHTEQDLDLSENDLTLHHDTTAHLARTRPGETISAAAETLFGTAHSEAAPMETERTVWLCENCGARGVVSYEPGVDVATVVYLIQDDHASMRTSCAFDLGRVKVEPMSPSGPDGAA